ncbi:MAG: DUF2442 domain-containing protein [Acidimicrobiia bacterium]
MARPARVVSVDHLGGHRLRLTFSDGLVRELDFADTLRGGVFTPLEDERVFAEVSVDPVAGTICWPNGVDLDPDVLHGDFEPESGRVPELLREHRLRPTG